MTRQDPQQLETLENHASAQQQAAFEMGSPLNFRKWSSRRTAFGEALHKVRFWRESLRSGVGLDEDVS